MKKSWALTSKILSKEKTIESRWYKFKRKPFDLIRKGEIVYFKEGKFVNIKCEVEKVMQFSDLNEKEIKEILNRYGKNNSLGIEQINYFYNLFKNKKYCILIFLKNPEKIKPFEINKKGYGNMCAWICIDDVDKIKK